MRRAEDGPFFYSHERLARVLTAIMLVNQGQITQAALSLTTEGVDLPEDPTPRLRSSCLCRPSSSSPHEDGYRRQGDAGDCFQRVAGPDPWTKS